VIPIEPSAKGEAAVEGLEQLVSGLEQRLDIDVGVLAAVPMQFEHTNDQEEVIESIQYPTPEVIGKRSSLMQGCWKKQCSAFTYACVHRDRKRDYEIDTLAQFDQLARYLEETVEIEAPDPPQPGELIDTKQQEIKL
jgi:hypothetical protein